MDKETALSELNSLCTVISDVDGAIPDRYVTPWRGELGSAFAVVAPTKIEQIQNLIDFAKRNNFKLLAQGERTGLVGASVPTSTEYDSVIVVSMERYRTRLEFNEVDKRVTVDAGYTLDEVNEFLKPFGVHIPINVSSNPMIGGAIATNIGGSRVLRFGDARKLLLGVEVVLADSELSVYSTLDKPRKDNSAPDFTGVFCGSFGKYGIVTAGSFETFPNYQSTYTAWFALNKNASLEGLISKLQNSSGDLLLACEFVGNEAVDAICKYEEIKSAFPLAQMESDLIFAEWGSTHGELDVDSFVEKILEEISNESMADEIAIVPSETTWRLRHLFSEALRNQGKLIGNDVSVSKDRVSEFISKVESSIAGFDSQLAIRPFGHLGDGGLHVNIVVEGQEKIDRWTDVDSRKVRQLIGEIACSMGGSFSAEHGLGSFNADLYENLVNSETKKLVSGFKKMCDPNNVLGSSGIKF